MAFFREDPTLPLPVTPKVASNPSLPSWIKLLTALIAPVSSKMSNCVASSLKIFVKLNLSTARLRESFGGCRVT
jgi:hypothetical protein